MKVWRYIFSSNSVPSDCDVELAVIDHDGIHALVFACRRIENIWVNAKTNTAIEVHPTHWREWREES